MSIGRTVEEQLAIVMQNTEILAEQKGIDYDAGVAAGKAQEWNAFWDTFQDNGNRIDYYYGFQGSFWSDVNFKPKYDIIAHSLTYGFRDCKITDLKGILEKQNIVLDVSNAKVFAYAFARTTITHIPDLDLRAATDLQYIFYDSEELVSIGTIKWPLDDSLSFNSPFRLCYKLQDVTFEGTISNTLNFQDCPLSRKSIMSVIDALSTTTAGKTITFKKKVVDAAFETSEGAKDGSTSPEWISMVDKESPTAVRPNWTFALK